MSLIIQWIVVGIALGAAVTFFAFRRRKRCNCGSCPLSEKCKHK